MQIFTEFLSNQPFLTLFMVIALGYGIGSINIKGFSLGVGAVIFSGLLVGAIAPKCQPPAMVGTIGLVMFLYGLGIQFGKQFFAGLTGATGRRYNLLAVLSLAAAVVVIVVLMKVMDISHSLMAGLFAGSGTNAASMQAATEAAKNNEPAVGYSVAYPFGLVGAILCMYFVQLFVNPNCEVSNQSGVETIEVAILSKEVIGRTLGEVMSEMPAGIQVMVVRREDKNRHPEPGLLLSIDDILLLRGSDSSSLAIAQNMLGTQAPGRITNDRGDMDYLRVFVSKPDLVGIHLSALRMPEDVEATITHVRRGDTEMLVRPDLILEMGDRIGIMVSRKYFQTMRNFFGNSVRGTAEINYISMGLGMVLGVLLGILPIPVPVLGTMKLGIAGGSLFVALILGKLGRTWKLVWTIPFSANLTLRNFGLSIFLAQVGMSSGAPFVNVVSNSGLMLLAAGACILLALALTPLLIGHYVMRIPFDDLLGITAGITGNPAILSYAYRTFPSDRVEACYAMIYPATTILKIVIALILIAVGAGV